MKNVSSTFADAGRIDLNFSANVGVYRLIFADPEIEEVRLGTRERRVSGWLNPFHRRRTANNTED